MIFSHGCSNSRGVAIVFCNGSNTDLKDVYKDDRGRILVIESLDYFLISHNLVDNVTRTEISPGIRTDHSAISLVISLHKDPVKGPGHWKFNNS